jgi:hypothetical protein
MRPSCQQEQSTITCYIFILFTYSVSLKEMASSMRKFEGGDKRLAVQARLYRIFQYLAIVL